MTSLKKIIIPLILCVVMIMNGCSVDQPSSTYSKYTYEFLGVFDTVIQFMGYAKVDKDFVALAKNGEARFIVLNQLFDIYNDYPGINNIKTINDNAGIKPVEVPQEVIDLLLFSIEWYHKTGGVVNIALGPVLKIWHEYRDAGINDPEHSELPPIEKLREAEKYTNINKIIIDKDKKTVYLSDKNMSIDVGAIAKGYATEVVAKDLQSMGYTSFIVSSGGNVRIIGAPLDGVRKKWGIGIQDPNGNVYDPEDYMDTVFTEGGSVVTSGDYQRYYIVDKIKYHHLIDPTTLMPANYYRSVSILTENSGEADFLSSTLFLLPYDESRRLADSLDGVEALWIMADGTIQVTDNMKKVLKNLGGATNK